MRNTRVLCNQEYLPTLQESKQGISGNRTRSMDNSDPRNNDVRQRPQPSASAVRPNNQEEGEEDAMSGVAPVAGRRDLAPYDSQNFAFGSADTRGQVPQMPPATGQMYNVPPPLYATNTTNPQRAGIQHYPQNQGIEQAHRTTQPPMTQMGFPPQHFPVQQNQPYAQNVYMQQGYGTMQTPFIQPTPARDPTERPVVKLSLQLIDVYKKINRDYYTSRNADGNRPAGNNGRDASGGNGQGAQNFGWDDENYDYILHPGEMIQGRYKIEERIGKGSFGQVVRAYDTETSQDVAIKIIKSRPPFLLQARTEIDLLIHLRERDPDDLHNIVRLLSHFMYRNHQCLVFEMLSLNLYELLRNTHFDGVSLNLIRKFAKQILKALQFLGRDDVDIIHCDLKPENILLRHPKRSGVKVIDFGSSCRSNNPTYSYIQSRFYRSPEVLLGLPYSVAIDMWSLGCILVEMHTGEPLFSGSDQVDQVQKIVKILGMIPDEILNRMNETQRNQFFERGQNGAWVLKRTAGQSEPIVPSGNPKESLKEVLRESDSTRNYDVFVDLIHQMLSYNPEERITPNQAIIHRFIISGN